MLEAVKDWAYLVKLVYFISMGYGETVVLVEDYRLYINFLLSMFANLLRKRLGQRYWQVIERRHGVLRQTQSRVSQ